MIIGKIDVVNNRKEEVKKELSQKIEKVLEDIGLKAESSAKLLCPVGTPESTGIAGYIGGTLKNSIAYLVEAPTVYIGTNVEYAPYVEFGTSRMEAKPFLMPAVKGQLDAYRQVIEQELKR